MAFDNRLTYQAATLEAVFNSCARSYVIGRLQEEEGGAVAWAE